MKTARGEPDRLRIKWSDAHEIQMGEASPENVRLYVPPPHTSTASRIPDRAGNLYPDASSGVSSPPERQSCPKVKTVRPMLMASQDGNRRDHVWACGEGESMSYPQRPRFQGFPVGLGNRGNHHAQNQTSRL